MIASNPSLPPPERRQAEFDLQPEGKRTRLPKGPTLRFRADQRQSRDTWFDKGLEVAKAMIDRDGFCWPDEWTFTMQEAGHPIGLNVGSFWAWCAAPKQGLMVDETCKRRMSRDPERNRAKIARWVRRTEAVA